MHAGKFDRETCPEALRNKVIVVSEGCSRQKAFADFMELSGKISDKSEEMVCLSIYSLLQAFFLEEGLVLPNYILVRCDRTSVKAEEVAKAYFEIYDATESVSLSISQRELLKKLKLVQDEVFFIRGEADSKIQNKRNNAQNNTEVIQQILVQKDLLEDGRKVRAMPVVISDNATCNFPLEDAALFDFSGKDIDRQALSEMLRKPYIRGNFIRTFIDYAEKNQNYIRGKIRESKEKCAGFACQISTDIESAFSISVACSQLMSDFARHCDSSLESFWDREDEILKKFGDFWVRNYEVTDSQGLDEIFVEKLREMIDADYIKVVHRISENVTSIELNHKMIAFLDEISINIRYTDFEEIANIISGNSCLTKEFLLALDEAGILIRNKGKRSYYERYLPILLNGKMQRKHLVSLRRESIEEFGEPIF